MNVTPNRKPAPTARLDLNIQFETRAAGLPARAKIRKWIRAAVKRNARITVRFVNAREGRALNARFRDRDYATNVLTFVYSGNRTLEGDIAICAPVVAREARELGLPAEARHAHMTVHGVLHLQGMDHQNEGEARRMERLEARILARLGYGDPYAALDSRADRPRRPIRKD